MRAVVYRCREAGKLLGREQIQANSVSGELRVMRKGMKRIAQLLGPDGERYMLPVLDKVKLLALNDTGVLLSGIEIHPARGAKGNGPMYPQTWWCILRGAAVQPEPSPAAARAREQVRLGQQIAASMLTHYSRRG